MKEKTNNRKSKTKLHKGMLLFYCSCALVLLCAFGIMTFRMVLTSQLNAKLDEIRTAGYPATLAELNDYYPAVSDDENAALLYEKAFSLYHSVYDNVFSKTDKAHRSALTFAEKVAMSGILLGEPLPESYKEASNKFITINGEVIALLKQAVKRSKCNFPVKFYENHSLDISVTLNFTNAVRLLATEATVAAQDKNIPLVVENILAMLKICHALDNRATGFSCSIRYDMQSITMKTIEYLLSLVELNSNSLQQIQSALEANLDKDNKITNRALACERIIGLNLEKFSDYWYDFSPSHQRDVIFMYKIFKHLGFDTLNQLKVLEVYEKLLALDKTDIKAVKHYNTAAEKHLRKLSIFYILAIETLSYTGFSLYERLIADTQIKGAIIGIAIERYRLKYHKLPKTLSKLSPEFIKALPNDPFTGNPFRYVVGNIEIPIDKRYGENYPDSYKKSKTLYHLFIKRPGWMIYSFGKDGDDDNGIPKGILLKVSNGDIPFRCLKSNSSKKLSNK
jgi:hypothetical protein